MGRVPLDHREGDHIVHLREGGQAQAGHLLGEILSLTGLVEQQLPCLSLVGDAVELEIGPILPHLIQAEVDGSPRRRVEKRRAALRGEHLVGELPAAGPAASPIPHDKLIDGPPPSQGKELPLTVSGRQQVFRLSRPCAQDGEALTAQIPKQQGSS